MEQIQKQLLYGAFCLPSLTPFCAACARLKKDSTGAQGHLNILVDKLEQCKQEVQDKEAEI